MGAKRTRDEDDAEEAFPRGGSGSGGDDLPRGGNTGGGGGGSGKKRSKRLFDDEDGGVRIPLTLRTHLHEYQDPWNLKSSRRPDIFADWLAPPPPTHRFFSTEPD